MVLKRRDVSARGVFGVGRVVQPHRGSWFQGTSKWIF